MGNEFMNAEKEQFLEALRHAVDEIQHAERVAAVISQSRCPSRQCRRPR